jgi:hypothetical protein
MQSLTSTLLPTKSKAKGKSPNSAVPEWSQLANTTLCHLGIQPATCDIVMYALFNATMGLHNIYADRKWKLIVI